MGKITILKDINKKEKNDFHTIRVVVSKFLFQEEGTKFKRTIDGDPLHIIRGWFKDSSYKESINATWSPIMDPSTGILSMVNRFMTMLGIGSLKTKNMYTQVWTNSEPVDIPLTLFFYAEDDAWEDVVLPIRRLQMLAVPIEKDKNDSADFDFDKLNYTNEKGEVVKVKSAVQTTFNATVGKLWDQLLLPPANANINLKNIMEGGGVGISRVEIGEFVTLKDVFLKSVDVDWDILNPDIIGSPTTATVNLVFRTRTVWTSKTISNFINGRTDTFLQPEVLSPGGFFKNIGKALGDISKLAATKE